MPILKSIKKTYLDIMSIIFKNVYQTAAISDLAQSQPKYRIKVANMQSRNKSLVFSFIVLSLWCVARSETLPEQPKLD